MTTTMEEVESKRTCPRWPYVGAVLAPNIVMSLLLVFAPWGKRGGPNHDTGIGFLLSIAAGEIFVLFLPIKWTHKIITFLVYLPVAWALLFFYALFFIALFLPGRLG